MVAGSFQVVKPLHDASEDADVAEGLCVAIENTDGLATGIVADIPRRDVQNFILRLSIERHHDDHFLSGKFGVYAETLQRQGLPHALRDDWCLLFEQFSDGAGTTYVDGEPFWHTALLSVKLQSNQTISVVVFQTSLSYPGCHAERSEASKCGRQGMLRFAQHDSQSSSLKFDRLLRGSSVFLRAV